MRKVARIVAIALLLGLVTTKGAVAQASKPVIRSDADLPPTRFEMPALPSASFMSDAFLTDDLPRYRAEGERLLADYDIQDPVIGKALRLGLAGIAILQDRPQDALTLVGEQRAVETKPQLREIGALIREGLAAGLLVPAGGRCRATAARMTLTLDASEPSVVRDEVLARYGTVQTASPGFHAGTAAIVYDPEAKSQGSLGILGAMGVVNLRLEAEVLPPCRSEMTAALKTWLDAPTHRPVNIWPAREPSDSDLVGAVPVVVAVWEAGFDADLFPGQIAFDPAEPLDGIDNDGNGVVDDAFGPTFDQLLRPTSERMPPPSPVFAARLGLQIALAKGLADLRFGDDTPEARLVAERSRSAGLDEQLADVRASDELNGWAHATWVASLIADGSPFVRLYGANVLPYGDNPDPVPFVEADAARWAAVLPGLASRLRGAGVRVVNMSWGSDADDFAEGLLRSGAETDAERAAQRGAAIAEVARTAIDGVIRDCPDILFVAAAGNTDQTDDILGSAPQTLDRPNLLIVGAAGTAGNPTAFTTYGSKVRVYALGEGNALRGPGGQILRGSGTSFASPVGARAAASMIAVDPALSPGEVIEGLLATAHAEGTSTLPLLDAGAAVRWARARRQPG